VISLRSSNPTLVSRAAAAVGQAVGSQGEQSQHVLASPQQAATATDSDLAKAYWKKDLIAQAFENFHGTPNGHLEVAKVVNSAGGQDLLIRTDHLGETFLHHVAYDRNVAIAKVLLQAGKVLLQAVNTAIIASKNLLAG